MSHDKLSGNIIFGFEYNNELFLTNESKITEKKDNDKWGVRDYHPFQ